MCVASGSPVAVQEIDKLRSQLVAALQREEDLETKLKEAEYSLKKREKNLMMWSNMWSIL